MWVSQRGDYFEWPKPKPAQEEHGPDRSGETLSIAAMCERVTWQGSARNLWQLNGPHPVASKKTGASVLQLKEDEFYQYSKNISK
jgi:hypothetical protein